MNRLDIDYNSSSQNNNSRWTTIMPGQDDEPVDPDWLVHGILAPGHLTILWGAKKLGKTTLINWLLKALENGTPFLGLLTKRSKALWLSEIPDILHRRQMKTFGLTVPYDVLTR